MADLSPAAQAVLDATFDHWPGGHNNPHKRVCIAAALAAVPTDGPAVQGREPASVAPEAIEPTATQSIRQAFEAVFARSPVPLTTDEVAAVVLRAALPHVLPLRDDTPWELLLVRGRLLDIATELDSTND